MIRIFFIQKKKHKAIFSDEDIPSPMLRYEANNTTNEVLAYVTDKTFEEKWKFVNERIGELKNSPDLPAYYLRKRISSLPGPFPTMVIGKPISLSMNST